MAAGTYKYLEVTDSDLSLLLVALEQASAAANDQPSRSIQALLDRISYSLSSPPSSHHSYHYHPSRHGHPDLACTTSQTTNRDNGDTDTESCNYQDVKEDDVETPSRHHDCAVDTTMSPPHASVHPNPEADTSPISESPHTANEQYVLDFLNASISVDQDMGSDAQPPEFDDLNSSHSDCGARPSFAGYTSRAKLTKLQLQRQHPYGRKRVGNFNDDNPPSGDVAAHGQVAHALIHPDPTCPRNGRHLAPRATWQEQARSCRPKDMTAHALIGALSSASIDSTSPSTNVRTWVADILSYLEDSSSIKLGGGSAMEDVISSCQTISQQHTGFSFVIMVAHMQLAIVCQSIIRDSVDSSGEKTSTIIKVYQKYVAKLRNPPVERSFYRWYSTGCRYISLVASGSFYILVLAAGLELRKTIAEVGGHIFSEVGQMLRRPETSSTPTLITGSIIPTIAWIRSRMPMSLEKLFCPSFIERAGVGDILDCTDIALTDKVFGAFQQNTYSLPARNVAAWSSCSSQVMRPNIIMRRECNVGGPLRPALHTLEHSLPPVPWTPRISIIKTSFRCDHSNNKCFPAKTDRRENAAWTEGERVKAEAGYIVKDVEDLRKMLDNIYVDGCRNMEDDTYLRIPTDVLQGGELELRNSDDSLMLFACSSLPDRIRRNLYNSLLACFDGTEVLVDKKLDKDFHIQDGSQPQTDPSNTTFSIEQAVENALQSPFQCLHFSLWNRYMTNGDDAPTHIHPHDMARSDVSRTNYSQRLPYPSRDTLQHQQLYRNIQSSFEELFQWIEQVIKKCLPREYDVLVELAQDLPGGHVSPVSPFLSLVVNLNVSTMGHRDRFDKDLCLVLPIGEFLGGALAMFEQRLVVELRNGDFMLFQSASTTHFNLHYEGKRASLVCHTDRGFEQWKEGRNGWGSNNHFN